MSRQRHSAKSSGPESERGKRKTAKNTRNPPAGFRFWAWSGVGVLAVLGAALLLTRPQAGSTTEISPSRAHEKYTAGAFFLDVRTQEEYDQEHIAKSVLIPLEDLQTRLSEIPRDQDVVVVCRSGPRSKEGAAILQQAGYTRVTWMTGGLQAWAAAGYPMEQ